MVDTLRKKRENIECVQETKWKGGKIKKDREKMYDFVYLQERQTEGYNME